MELEPKFIIENNCLIIGKVVFHKHLLIDEKDKTNARGGGWFRYDQKNRMFIFYGESFELGKAKFEDIKACIDNKEVYSDKHQIINISEDYSFAYDNGLNLINF